MNIFKTTRQPNNNQSCEQNISYQTNYLLTYVYTGCLDVVMNQCIVIRPLKKFKEWEFFNAASERYVKSTDAKDGYDENKETNRSKFRLAID